ncbi:MAG TPA: uroporphyrinogen-III synthase, partial [Candidatus Polarisedimenticolia bacterium]|nr:uroporphyrinogen-III synthase [Candidatus Polarisedimenticolia bacterium]
LETESGVDSRWLLEHLRELKPGTALAWTSRRAADVLAMALPDLRELLQRLPLYAVGEESATPLKRAGLRPLVPPDALGAAELARFIASRAAGDGVRRVVFLHGNRALSDLPDGLRERGIEVEFLEVYRTRFLAPDFGSMEEAVREQATVIVAFFSPSGVEAFERLLKPDSRTWFRERAHVIARGLTTADALRRRGYRHVLAFEPSEPFSAFASKALQAAAGGVP